MSLQGTLDTFSLPEILELVEKSRKTGALEVRDPQSRGVLYFAGGRFSAAEAGDLSGPVDSTEELEARLIDVCFALFRVEAGLFEFEHDRFPPWPVRGGSEVGAVVEQVQQLRRDWLAIEAVLPSLDCRPGVVDDLDGDRVVLDKAGFRVLRVVDGERNVREIARAVGRSVLEVCKVLKDLVEAGAVAVPVVPDRTMVDELVLTDPVAEGDPAPEAAPGPEPAPEPEAVAAAFPEHAADELDRLPDLPELPDLPGLVVPSSPEGLDAHISGAHITPEAEQSREVAATGDGATGDGVTAGESRAGDSRAGESRADEPPAGAPPAGEDHGDDDEEPAPDRGALLRLFSSLRDT